VHHEHALPKRVDEMVDQVLGGVQSQNATNAAFLKSVLDALA